MKKKELEIMLQKTPGFKQPQVALEQYITPANIVADIVFTAYQFNDIKDKKVLDLGCGTGIFSIAAWLTGAKKVIGIDVDKKSVEIAKGYAKEHNLDITYQVKDISQVNNRVDTILMNPPFGAQKSNKKADRKFIEKGFSLSSVFYSLHLTKTIAFIQKMVETLSGEITFTKQYSFPIKHSLDFHKKERENFDVTMIRVITGNKKIVK